MFSTLNRISHALPYISDSLGLFTGQGQCCPIRSLLDWEDGGIPLMAICFSGQQDVNAQSYADIPELTETPFSA